MSSPLPLTTHTLSDFLSHTQILSLIASIPQSTLSQIHIAKPDVSVKSEASALPKMRRINANAAPKPSDYPYPLRLSRGLHNITAIIKASEFPKRLFTLTNIPVLIQNEDVFNEWVHSGSVDPVRVFLECPTQKRKKKRGGEEEAPQEAFSDSDDAESENDEEEGAIRHSKYDPNLYFTLENDKNIFGVLDLRQRTRLQFLSTLCREKLLRLAVIPSEPYIGDDGALMSRFQIIVHVQRAAILDKVQIDHYADLDQTSVRAQVHHENAAGETVASSGTHQITKTKPVVMAWQKLFTEYLRDRKRKAGDALRGSNSQMDKRKKRRLTESGGSKNVGNDDSDSDDDATTDTGAKPGLTATPSKKRSLNDTMNDEDDEEDEDMNDYLASDAEEEDEDEDEHHRSAFGGAESPSQHDGEEEFNAEELLSTVTASLEDLYGDEFNDDADNDEDESTVDVNAFLGKINAKQPDGLQRSFTLRPYQQQALRWMVKRELTGVMRSEARLHPQFKRMTFPDGREFYYSAQRGILTFERVPAPPEPPGGILADEMGLGKTLETITVFLANPGHNDIGARDENNYLLSNATLVVCPLSLLNQWKDEIEKFTDPRLNVLCYQGTRRAIDVHELARYDVVITTYQTLTKEHGTHQEVMRLIKQYNDRSPETIAKLSPMYQIKFHRICLDEAHNIKNRTSLQHRACVDLIADRRWALTGTPIQNHLDDVFALFAFLKMKPHGEWEWWSRNISRPYQNKNPIAVSNLQNVLSNIMLRRTKKKQINGKAILKLPEKIIHLKELTFSQAEAQLYNILQESTKESFDKMTRDGAVGKSNFTGMLEIISMARMLCCHPALLVKTYLKNHKSYMYDILKQFYDLGPHVYSQVLPFLPDVMAKRPVDLKRELNLNWRGSTKIDALCENIMELPQGDQAVVFSQWTSLMDFVEIAFEKNGIKFVRLDGSMSSAKRDSSIKQFKNDPTVRVGLISLMAGGVGLNLTWASHVFLIDPWWNPAIEAQAIDRVHRMDSKKEVHVVRFAVVDTIEQRMHHLQRTKGEVADFLLGDSVDEGSQSNMAMPGPAGGKKKKKELQKEKLKHMGYLLGYNELEELVEEEEQEEQEIGMGGARSGMLW